MIGADPVEGTHPPVSGGDHRPCWCCTWLPTVG